ncbi:histidine kinase [Mycolicibacterium novocastrense]|uniref:sensor histidine kinase n=1 Tax=Mycolicibacterium novocastrense TaxID=59813 RepID=UPI000749D34B|nr:sensor histidine kinase [Mycolicibacterium novocastrense]KUH75782.1 histidine kinase [Mycolicibacterium novocastrense]KUH78343.1 histidine kinase [Mycolicibacterium novocastrense]KUH79678.1 histidine kinase [Mycolicibacterium novocastrense]
MDQEVAPVVAGTIQPPAYRHRHLGVVPSASLITGAVLGIFWLWVPIAVAIAAVVFIPSVLGSVLAVIVFVYLMRGVEWLERLRSQAVFGMSIPVPPRKNSPYSGVRRWLHQLWLDITSTRFWKGCTHHFIRTGYDIAAGGLALVLLAFAFLAPAATIAVSRSDDDAGLSFLPPSLTWPLAVVALIAAVAIVVFAPLLDARIDRWLLSQSPAAMLQHEVDALADARLGAVSSAHTERNRIERDLHDSVQPRLVSLAMTIGLAQTKLDTDPSAAKALIVEAHEDAKTALVELRNVVRGIAPTILRDRGLDAALSAVVHRAAVPTTLDIDLPRRVPHETESVAYFLVAEALTNVAKHAQASRAEVRVRLDEPENTLHVSVFDDGRGGARITSSETATGLRGLADRVRAARGTFTVSSPDSGPTTITAVLPCAS